MPAAIKPDTNPEWGGIDFVYTTPFLQSSSKHMLPESQGITEKPRS